MHDAKNETTGHGDEVFVFIEHYFPVEGKLEQVLEIAREAGQLLKGWDGLLMMQVLRPAGGKGPVSSLSIWESQDKFKAMMKSDTCRELFKSDSMKRIQSWTTEVQHVSGDLVDGWHRHF